MAATTGGDSRRLRPYPVRGVVSPDRGFFPLDRVVIGGAPSGDERSAFSHIIDCRSAVEGGGSAAPDAVVLWHPAPTVAPLPAAWFDTAVCFARDALRDPAARLLVHCSGGKHRAPSLAYAILRAVFGLGPAEARAAICMARPSAKFTFIGDAERYLAVVL